LASLALFQSPPLSQTAQPVHQEEVTVPVHQATDEQLMEQLCQGQTDALDELYARYARALYAFCANVMRASALEDAEDVVQDVFVRLIKSAQTFDPRRASFRTWLYRIARNRCLDLIRRQRLLRWVPIRAADEQEDDSESAIADLFAAPGEGIEETVIRDATARAIRHCIAQLANENERQALLLYYMADKVYREIGQMMAKSTSMARNWVKSAQDKVKKCLEGLGVLARP
jgi:RNA polymerase sigma-70 factor (ECF subfamily)